ncbi:MAG: nucleotidyltransferase domain-containing protein [Thermotogae bacterium]|nr:nucleotidyltransferase domain-containing protein [Thermotogota bacterium]
MSERGDTMETSQLVDGEVRKIIKKVISDTLKKYDLRYKRLILFGSRAKGKNRKDSDWDILTIVDGDLDSKVKKEIKAIIRMKIAQYRIPIDIILQTTDEVEHRKNDVGYLVYYALKEGVEL